MILYHESLLAPPPGNFILGHNKYSHFTRFSLASDVLEQPRQPSTSVTAKRYHFQRKMAQTAQLVTFHTAKDLQTYNNPRVLMQIDDIKWLKAISIYQYLYQAKYWVVIVWLGLVS
jgi:DNA-binding LytR/AlgR family response regulator